MTVITISRKALKAKTYKEVVVDKRQPSHKRDPIPIARALKRAIADMQEGI